MTTRRILQPLAVVVALLLPSPATAQSGIGLEGGGLGYMARHRIRFQGAVSELTGLWFGGEGRAHLGPIAVEGRALMGKLSGTTTRTNPERTVRVSSVGAQFAVMQWLAVGGVMEARRFETSGLVTVWKLIGGEVRATPSFGIAGLTGLLDARVLPSASITGDATMSMAIEAQAGFEYVMPGSGLMLRVGYRLERFDFKESGSTPARLEQVSGLTVGAGFRLGR